MSNAEKFELITLHFLKSNVITSSLQKMYGSELQ